MITLIEQTESENGYILEFEFEHEDELSELPGDGKPFGPEYYPISYDYGVPDVGSVAVCTETGKSYYYNEDDEWVEVGSGGSETTPEVLFRHNWAEDTPSEQVFTCNFTYDEVLEMLESGTRFASALVEYGSALHDENRQSTYTVVAPFMQGDEVSYISFYNNSEGDSVSYLPDGTIQIAR